jgi:hypothetical protein
MVEQMIFKMQLIISVHKTLLENVEQALEETKEGVCSQKRVANL